MLGASAAAGATIEYLFDPVCGRSRRAKVRDQASHAAHELTYGLGRLSRDLNNRSRGVAAGTRFRLTGRSVDDRVLHERVRAELGRHLTHPHAVHVSVEDRVARLEGDVLSREARRAARAVRRIPGVKGVDARWHVHRDPSGVPQLQGVGRSRQPVPQLLHQHWAPSARFLAGTAAAALWVLARRFPPVISWTLRGAGAALGARAATNLPLRRLTGINAGRRAIDVNRAISIAARPEEIWPLVSDYSVFARFMPDVREVRRSADGLRSHWEISGPAGRLIRFDAVETSREEGKHIAWKSIEGQLIAHTGAVRLAPEDGGRTRVQVELTYNPVVGAAGHAVARLLGADPVTKLKEDLMRLKSYVEGRRQPVTSR
ncbi:SRPBCC family protein [Nonomuraea basaltis]|uniref:SRPBCC family protein n=1 Tax=Nonomuraea basaltis TaxID=2495887 RepID=UPI0014864EBB|nr:SRPBCC family protein [Nonomuraea basaltis]